jgi:hypothetical protein
MKKGSHHSIESRQLLSQKGMGHFSSKKGKSFKEFYGQKKAKEISEKIRLKNLGKKASEVTKEKMRLHNGNRLRKGKTLEEIYGEKIAKEMKENLRIKRLGKKHSISTIQKMIRTRNTDEAIKQNSLSHLGKPSGRKIPNKSLVIKTLEEMTKSPFLKTELRKRTGFAENTFRQKWGSLDNFAKLYNIKFKDRECMNNINGGNIGKLEQQAFEQYKQQNPNNIIIQQFRVNRFFCDWYDKTTNTIYEFDEEHHKRQTVQDFLRQKIIENMLDCNVIRIEKGETRCLK